MSHRWARGADGDTCERCNGLRSNMAGRTCPADTGEAPMDQHLIDYTVRNITTGDEEEIRVLELTDEEAAELPADARAVLEPHRALWAREQAILRPDWERDQERIRELLLPLISQPELYDDDYARWEDWVLNIADDELADADKARAQRMLGEQP